MKKLLILATLAGLCTACGSSSTAPSAPPIPQYGGTWSGTYTITGCNQTGIFVTANLCSSLGAAPPYSFQLSQSQRNVTGTFTLGSVNFPSTGGTIGADGSLGLNATTVSSGITVAVTWALNMPASSITGTITQVWTATGLGQANVAGTISTANHTAVAARTLHAIVPRTVDEFIAAITQ